MTQVTMTKPTDPAMVPADELPTYAERITKLDLTALPDGRYRVLAGTGSDARLITLRTYGEVMRWVMQHLKEVG